MYLPTYSTIGQTPVLQELPRVARVVLTRDARWKGGGGRGKGRERFKGNGGFRDSESRNFLTVIFFFFFFLEKKKEEEEDRTRKYEIVEFGGKSFEKIFGRGIFTIARVRNVHWHLILFAEGITRWNSWKKKKSFLAKVSRIWRVYTKKRVAILVTHNNDTRNNDGYCIPNDI